MSSRKPKRQTNRQPPQPNYDSDSDYPNYLASQPAEHMHHPTRTNEELNLSVLRRHDPSINTILSLAPYAVVYIFNPGTRQWEKSGVEGTMFVCQLAQGSLGEERYSLFVLNRRGLDNFDVPLTDGENVEITDEYVILKSDSHPELDTGGIVNTTLSPAATAAAAVTSNGNHNHNSNSNSNNNNNNKSSKDIRIYGLWIYSEPPPNSTAEIRSLNAQVIRECAVHAGQSLKHAREAQEAARQNGLHLAAAAAASKADPVDEAQSSVPMGRQISLKDLFGQQRAQDDEWSVKAHSLAPEMQRPGMQNPSMPGPGPRQDVLGDLFRRADLAYGQGYS